MRTKQQAMKRRRTKGLAYAALLAGLGLAALLALALAPGAGERLRARVRRRARPRLPPAGTLSSPAASTSIGLRSAALEPLDELTPGFGAPRRRGRGRAAPPPGTSAAASSYTPPPRRSGNARRARQPRLRRCERGRLCRRRVADGGGARPRHRLFAGGGRRLYAGTSTAPGRSPPPSRRTGRRWPSSPPRSRAGKCASPAWTARNSSRPTRCRGEYFFRLGWLDGGALCAVSAHRALGAGHALRHRRRAHLRPL